MRTKPTPTTSIARSDIHNIFVREVNLVDDIIGKMTFTEMFLLQLTGKKPPAAHVRILDTVLVTLMEHGITPSAIATRLIYHSAPDALQAAVAAGLLGVGTTFIGTMEGCAASLEEIIAAPEGMEARARAIAERHHTERKPLHGFGHPHHKPDDPRTPAMLAVRLCVNSRDKSMRCMGGTSPSTPQARPRRCWARSASRKRSCAASQWSAARPGWWGTSSKRARTRRAPSSGRRWTRRFRTRRPEKNLSLRA
jgi:hypothetical protein